MENVIVILVSSLEIPLFRARRRQNQKVTHENTCSKGTRITNLFWYTLGRSPCAVGAKTLFGH
jgi:hypothetical protein